MPDYTLERRLGQDFVMLSSEYGSQLWSKITLRKDTTCEELNITLPKGTKAYRPSTNRYNRMHRISEAGMDAISK